MGGIQLWNGLSLTPISAGGYAAVPASKELVGTSDLDGNGIRELLLRDPSRDRVEVWTLGAAGLAPVATFTALANASLASSADFTGDGKSDLLWRPAGSNQLVLRTLTLGTLPLADGTPASLDSRLRNTLTSTPSGAAVAGAADYNGDGSVDLLWRSINGALTLWYLDAGRFDRAVPLAYASGDRSYKVVGSVAADGTSGAEIALQHSDTGVIEMLHPRTGLRLTVLHPGSQWSVIDVSL